MKLETAVVSHVSTTRRLVTRKINDDADMSPVGLLLLVSRDGSRKEVDCDPRGQAWGTQSELQGSIYTTNYYLRMYGSSGLCVGIHTGSEP